MKKKFNWNICILIVAIVIFGAYICYAKIINDSDAPKVTCASDEITVSVESSQQELLKGVTAVDERDGDVTSSLIVESISAFADDERIITYAAVDESGNVGRASRTLKYTDYQAPRFSLEEPLRFAIGSKFDVMKGIKAESSLDGDLTGKVKFSQSSVLDKTKAGEYEGEFRVADSTGTVSYLPVKVQIYDPMADGVKVELNQYVLYLEKGEAFNPRKYFKGSSPWGALRISSNVNTAEAGVYTVDYTVSYGSSKGESRLVVVVTEA